MGETYLVSEWALIRRNELTDIPNELEIHPDFLQTLSRAEFESAFKEIGMMFYRIYSDMADSPQRFGLPLHKVGEYDYFSNQARETRTAPWHLFYFLYCLFVCGENKGNEFVADTAEIKNMNKSKKTNCLLEVLGDYGFVFGGIKKYSLSSGEYLIIEYPDNRNVIEVLSMVAKKVKNTQMTDVKNYFSNAVAFSNAFIGWNHRILAEDRHTCSLAEGGDYVADKIHDEKDREVIFILDQILTERGYTRKKGDANEGPSVRYHKGAGPYDYALVSDKGKLYLEMRIRNAESCLPFVSECPEGIVESFRYSDSGCQNRINETCKFGVGYRFENEDKWHCGCCGAPFRVHPLKEDISYYLKLLELGRNR